MATDEFFVELNRDHPNHMALYIFPESAVSALAALDRYRAWREKPVGELKRFEVRSGAAEELIQEVRQQGRRQLTAEESLRLIGYYGIPVAKSTLRRELGGAGARGQRASLPGRPQSGRAGFGS